MRRLLKLHFDDIGSAAGLADPGLRVLGLICAGSRAAAGPGARRCPAQARGELPPQLSPGTIADIVFGVIWYRLLATGQQLDGRLAAELTAALAGPPSPAAPAAQLGPEHV